MRMIQHTLAFLLGTLVLSLPLTGAILNEQTAFEERHEGVDFPVGWTDIRLGGVFAPQVRMVYPAMEAGEDAEMAGNGPFPWTVFIGDAGESRDSYMLVSESLAKRGFIVVVTDAMDSETDVSETLMLASDIVEVMIDQNESNAYILGTPGNIDVDHWGVGGHGEGATAAYTMFPFWNESSLSESQHPPRALFGLAMDLANLDEDYDIAKSNSQFPTPNTGFFITGTVDEVSPSQETMEQVRSMGGIGWQWMHLLGADHYQFQDSTSFFESDGDPSMSQSAQINVSTTHVVAYLDSVLHGDTSRFRDAFNREQAHNIVSDSSAYIDEDLRQSSFLRLNDTTVSHNSTVTLNATQTFVMTTNWSLRNGDTYLDLPASWTTEVTCGWKGQSWIANATLENATASCSFPMQTVAPGFHEAWMQVSVEGAPSTVRAQIARTNTPIILASPLPTIYLPQHGTASLNLTEVAIDPDGQIVRATQVNMTGLDAEHFEAAISLDGTVLIVEHALDEEWLGEAMLNVSMESDGGVLDEANAMIRVLMLPVDDPAEKTGIVPQITLEEDGVSKIFDFGTIISDPEGEPLIATISGQTYGETEPVQYAIQDGILTLTPLPNANGGVVLKALVGDGTTQWIEVDVPVLVEPRNDPVIINATEWEDITLDEDSSHTLILHTMAYDIDGDVLVWTYSNENEELQIIRILDEIVITPQPDVFGTFTDVWINVTDGESTHSVAFLVNVTPVADSPVVSVNSLSRIDGGNTATMQWQVFDVDGEVNTQARVFFGADEVAVNHSCLASTVDSFQCVTLLPIPEGVDELILVQVKVTDEALGRDIVATYTFDPGIGSTTTPPTSDTTSSFDLETEWVVGALVLVLALGVGLVRLTRKPSNDSFQHTHLQDSEPTSSTESQGGLLARAKNFK
ncbi:MAG: cadherin-like domain-containing protein [Candidatus Poseidonia sp.]|nr:cadherin-like domain-containing protein [Poseidonia sp.]